MDTNVKFMGPYMVSQEPPLYLSGITKEDLPEMVRVANLDQAIFNGTGTFLYPFLDSHAEQRLAGAERYRANRGYNGQWAMRTRPDGPLIGWISVYEFEEADWAKHPVTGRALKTVETGYWMSSEYAGQGLTSRAMLFIKEEIVVKELQAELFTADAYVWNRASQRVLEKIGMSVSVANKKVFIPKFGEEREVVTYVWYADGV
ncbi:hypothetical protein DFQ27_007930 [Actinomortierella ambigua]|uniref:N-acetyltransferase domain-containing protein n=1 Tax=Actinomortierella ambigua TaxID=1343610 RepID=A0A9P6PTX2_9FUNG|nr:hypothetical protein DFQ27_007930 [Actinomortierella ambigua]